MAKSFESQLIAHVASARERAQAGAAELHRLTESRQYSDEYKSTLKAEAAGTARADVQRHLTDAAERMGAHRGKAEAQLASLQPSDAALAAAAVILAPVVNVASTNPSALVKTYQRVYTDPAQRALIEKVAESLPDILPVHLLNEFAPAWQRAQAAMAPKQSAEEQAARAELARSDRAMAYLESARDVVASELQAATNNGIAKFDAGASIHVTNARFSIQQFEKEHSAE